MWKKFDEEDLEKKVDDDESKSFIETSKGWTIESQSLLFQKEYKSRTARVMMSCVFKDSNYEEPSSYRVVYEVLTNGDERNRIVSGPASFPTMDLACNYTALVMSELDEKYDSQ